MKYSSKSKHVLHFSDMSLLPKMPVCVPVEVNLFGSKVPVNRTVYFSPDLNHSCLLKREIMGQEGVYPIQKNHPVQFIRSEITHPASQSCNIFVSCYYVLILCPILLPK